MIADTRQFRPDPGLICNHPTMGKVKLLTDAEMPPGEVKAHKPITMADFDKLAIELGSTDPEPITHVVLTCAACRVQFVSEYT